MLYEINVDNDGDGRADITYQFRFTHRIRNPDTFLYNTGPITSLDSPNWNRRQFYTVTRVDKQRQATRSAPTCPARRATSARCPRRTTPRLATAAVNKLRGGGKVFAGQRAEGFYVDLGAIFDLGDLRPFQQLHTFARCRPRAGRQRHQGNERPLDRAAGAEDRAVGQRRRPTRRHRRASTIGVWTTREPPEVAGVDTPTARDDQTGPFPQVSRLGNPLVNEVIIPLGKKDLSTPRSRTDDSQFAPGVAHPELPALLPVLYPGVFPNLDALNKSGKPRADLEAILLTGIPAGVVPSFQNYTGPTQADMLRLNLAIPPTTSNPSNLGLIGGDPAGYPERAPGVRRRDHDRAPGAGRGDATR